MMFLGILLFCGLYFNLLYAKIDMTDICLLPMTPGNCIGYFSKWYYNKKTKKCEKFIYGGCGGNANRFDTEEDCRIKCEDTCALPNHVGDKICVAYIPRWWYNFVTKQCEPFIYGGCAGTRNNFLTEEACFKQCDKTGCDYADCSQSPCPYGHKMTKKGCRNPKCICECPCCEEVKKCKKNRRGRRICKKKIVKKKCPEDKTCVVEVDPCSKPPCPFVGKCKPEASVPAPKPACQQKPDSGCGKKKISQWYYDTFFLQGCTKFFYSDVGGNDNRFNTEEECKANCH